MKGRAAEKFAHAIAKIRQGNKLVKEGLADLDALRRQREKRAPSAQEVLVEAIRVQGQPDARTALRGRL